MSIPAWSLRVLLFSADPAQTELIEETLRHAGYDANIQCIGSAEEFSFLAAAAPTAIPLAPLWDIALLVPSGVESSATTESSAGAEIVSCFRQFIHLMKTEVPCLVVDHAVDFDLSPLCESTTLQRLGADIARSTMKHQAQLDVAKARQETAEVLRRSEERYRALVESTFDLVCELDDEGRCIYVSPNYGQRLGFAAGDLIGKPIFDRVHPEEQDKVVAKFANLMAGRPNGPVEFRHVHKNGDWVWLEGAMRVMRGNVSSTREDHQTQARRVVLIARDIGERKRYESEMASLISLAKAINAQTDLPAMAEELNTHLKPLLPFDTVFIALLRNGELDFISPDATTPIKISRLEHPNHPVWQAVEQGAPWMVNRWTPSVPPLNVFSTDSAVVPATALPASSVEEESSRAFIKVPLAAHGQIIGVLCFESHRPYVFTEEHVRLAGMAGEQVAVAVHQVRLLENTLRAEGKYRTLVQDVDAIVWEADPETLAFTFVNPQAQTQLGFPMQDWLQNPDFWPVRIHPEDRERVLAQRQEAILQGSSFQLEYRVLTASGSVLWLRDLGRVEVQNGKALRVRGLMIDITERKQFEMTLLERNTILKAVQEAAADGICVMDTAGAAVSTNRRFKEMWPIPSELLDELRDKNQILEWIASKVKDSDAFTRHVNTLAENAQAESREELRLKDERLFECYSAPAMTPEGESFGRVWSFRDITARERFEQQLAHQAFHDSLTDLPNRALFVDRLEHALARSGRAAKAVGVLFLDLDRFKVVNDSLGHQVGDKLLIQVSDRLRRSIRPTDTAARFGGDEFTVLVEEITTPDDATQVANRILEGLQAPFHLAGHEVHVSSSIGIALSTTAADTADELLRKADVAMYWSKNKGGGGYEFFDAQMSAQALDRLQLEIDLRQAVKRNQLRLRYQPLVNLESGRIVGAEALLRWDHPTRGVVNPDDFIPLAEETGMILPIGKWVLHQACSQARQWQREFPGNEGMKISINISAKQLEQSGLASEISEVLRETELQANRLELEITESVVMKNVRENIDQLEAIRKLGVKLAIDDFGTGYSSLSYLEHFPLDALKIDRTFVGQIGSSGSSDGLAILKAVSTLGQTLGVSVTAEGIETADQRAQLRALSCEIGQGFHFAEPLAPEALNVLLLRNSSL